MIGESRPEDPRDPADSPEPGPDSPEQPAALDDGPSPRPPAQGADTSGGTVTEATTSKAAPRKPAPRPEPVRPDVPDVPDVTPDGLDDPEGLTPDEAELRALMREAVSALQASPDALEHLRRAVPLRRQRRRQAAFGAVAAVLLAGLAVPAVIRAADTSDRTDAAPAGLSSSASTASPSGDRTRLPGSRSLQPPSPSGGASSQPQAGTGPTDDPGPSDTAQNTPDCASTQLGDGTSSAGSPDANGRVYGWFRVSNVSTSSCTVPSAGLVSAVPQGGTPGSVQVVTHTAGDAAAGLPAPDLSGPVVLGPGQDYEVAFAWVPTSGGCTSDPTTPPASPTTTPTATTSGGPDEGTGATTGGAASGDSGSTHQTPPTAPSSAAIELDHTPAAGAPVVPGPVIPNACSGTVYTSSAIPGPSSTPDS